MRTDTHKSDMKILEENERDVDAGTENEYSAGNFGSPENKGEALHT